MNATRTMHARPEAAVNPSAVAAPEASVETGIDNFLLLFQRELAKPLKDLAILADRIEELRDAGFMPTTLVGQQTFAELGQVARHSADVSGRLLALGEVLSGPPLLADERILLADVLRQTATGLADAARSRGVGFRLDDGRQNLAPVYGSEHWLEVSLHALLGLMAQTAPPGTHLQLRLRQVGFHQLLTASINHNLPAASSIDLLKGVATTVKEALGAATRIDELDLLLARAIVEQHGGTLRIDQTGNGQLQQFNLSLPTGGESKAMRQQADCGHCPFMQQAEQFAQDIGELLNTLNTEQQTLTHGSK